jgi:hypothetical protein
MIRRSFQTEQTKGGCRTMTVIWLCAMLVPVCGLRLQLSVACNSCSIVFTGIGTCCIMLVICMINLLYTHNKRSCVGFIFLFNSGCRSSLVF